MSSKDKVISRSTEIKRSSLVGIIGNGLLAILKLIVGVMTHSAAVVADGIDSASDIVTSIITYYAGTVSDMPPDKEHPWGHSRIETISSKLISMLILFAGIQLVITTVKDLINNTVYELPGNATIVVTVISMISKALIASYKFKVAKRIDSEMIRADAINMKNDIYLSATVLIGLGVMYTTGLYIVDTIVGVLLGIWIIKTGVELSLQSNAELMDSFDNPDPMYKKLFAIVEKNHGAFNPHKARIRKINNMFVINLDIEVDYNLNVEEGHKIAKAIQKEVHKEFVSVYDVLIHVEPKGNVEEEQFGLSPKDFDEK